MFDKVRKRKFEGVTEVRKRKSSRGDVVAVWFHGSRSVAGVSAVTF